MGQGRGREPWGVPIAKGQARTCYFLYHPAIQSRNPQQMRDREYRGEKRRHMLELSFLTWFPLLPILIQN